MHTNQVMIGVKIGSPVSTETPLRTDAGSIKHRTAPAVIPMDLQFFFMASEAAERPKLSDPAHGTQRLQQ